MIHALITIGLVGLGLYIALHVGAFVLLALGHILKLLFVTIPHALADAIHRIWPKWL